MELFFLYLKLIAVSIVGMSFQLLVKSKSQQEFAKNANAEYSLWIFIKKDRATIIGTFLTVSLLFLILGGAIENGLNNAPDHPKEYFYGILWLSIKDVFTILVICLFATVAYMGQDAALRFFGRTSKELNNIMDRKTTERDAAAGELNTPTPLK